MGYYSEYLNKQLSFLGLEHERKLQLKRISELRGRDVLVYASDLTKNVPHLSIDYSDKLPFADQLANLSGRALDVIIETPGGQAEVVEDVIDLMRGKYERLGMIIPGWAKSAGTILVMAGDEILMGPNSGLGPIDAQILRGSKRFSAHAFLEGLDRIKTEVDTTGKLNPAYIPMLQNISPGEIQHCYNAQEFSRELVTEWLVEYKFKYWDKRSSSGEVVTPEYKRQRAEEIARKLCDQSHWLTHGRSIRIADLEKDLNLQVIDYSKNAALNEAITRYYTLMRMTFETNLYKLVETPNSQIYRFTGLEAAPAPKPLPAGPAQAEPEIAECQLTCSKCGRLIEVQASLGKPVPPMPGKIPFPVANNLLKCPSCGTEHNLANLRLQIEAQSGKKLV